VGLAVWVGVLVIGGLGAVLRFLVDVTLSARLGRSFPYGTLAVNLSGSAVLGLLTGLALGREEALLAGTAAVGSYTTFSTWMFETQRLGEDRQAGYLVANLVVSLVAGVVAAAVGRWIGMQL
jgi:fluoride exporter